MATIPIHNETEYSLTEAMQAEILRDAQEHFGSDVRAVRVQSGLTRHALNARTREVRYAFSPQDFGLGLALAGASPTSIKSTATTTWTRRPRKRAAPVPFEDITETEETLDHRQMSLKNLGEGHDEGEEDEPLFSMDEHHTEEDRSLDHEEEEDRSLDHEEEDSGLDHEEEEEEEWAPPYQRDNV